MSVRIETIGDCTLYLGDCRDLLGSISADHVISDPPYEDELHAAAKAQSIIRNDGGRMHGDLGFTGINAVRAETAVACVKASSGWVILFSLAEGVRAWRDDLQKAGAKWDTTCFWIKPDSTPRFNGQGPARGAECFVTSWAGKGYRRWNGGGKRGVYTHCVNTGRQGEHPTEKPVPLMLEIVRDFTQGGQTVLDPFMGPGTTGVACVASGRRFIGIEREERWFDLACRRIEAAYTQPRLFAETAVKSTQPSLLEGMV